ncbi:hypothetical protein TL16_g12602 [Triparma laevis f. inornata]|uniref:Uncharacterized protein n=1 Tax=Triparma laevis f. inornata TaxID=1714386 RepID=A0A9W7BVW1_9STRA|nr:hypothetical protein TL16_g12602 [Triparma laevis f. inornata]
MLRVIKSFNVTPILLIFINTLILVAITMRNSIMLSLDIPSLGRHAFAHARTCFAISPLEFRTTTKNCSPASRILSTPAPPIAAAFFIKLSIYALC